MIDVRATANRSSRRGNGRGVCPRSYVHVLIAARRSCCRGAVATRDVRQRAALPRAMIRRVVRGEQCPASSGLLRQRRASCQPLATVSAGGRVFEFGACRPFEILAPLATPISPACLLARLAETVLGRRAARRRRVAALSCTHSAAEAIRRRCLCDAVPGPPDDLYPNVAVMDGRRWSRCRRPLTCWVVSSGTSPVNHD